MSHYQVSCCYAYTKSELTIVQNVLKDDAYTNNNVTFAQHFASIHLFNTFCRQCKGQLFPINLNYVDTPSVESFQYVLFLSRLMKDTIRYCGYLIQRYDTDFTCFSAVFFLVSHIFIYPASVMSINRLYNISLALSI